ncbi:MAG TPA: DUF3488 and transglutaminase-like domain-containing protein [Gammaproteobacteria bacterium]
MAALAQKSVPDLLTPSSILWLIIALSLSILPHIVRIPMWLSLAAVCSIGYRLSGISRETPKPSAWILWPLVLACLFCVTTYYGKFFGRDAGVSLLIIMLSLKLQETRTHRDGMVLIGLVYFGVITHFLYDQTIPLFCFMLCAVAVNTFALITLNEGQMQIAPRQKIRMVQTLLLSALPIMLVLFVLFPRIPGPLWGLPQDAYTARTGLSDHMTPGEFSQLALSDQVAFRVTFKDRVPKPDQLYWRTLILENFDGRSWRIGDKRRISGLEKLIVEGEPVSYTVTIEPHQRTWLYALDMPTIERSSMLNGDKLDLTTDRMLRTTKPLINLSQYSAVSYPKYRLGVKLNQYQLQRALQLPANSNPRSVELARSWRERNQDPWQSINHALDMFHQDFTYTLRPPTLGRDSVDEFLFTTKRGFCEHFAGSFVFLMRAAGIPARVVTGYQGGEFNPLANYFLVRQSDAHAWAEVWLQQYGWIRIDPTSAVSPARIERGLEAAIPLSERTGLFWHRSSFFVKDFRLFWDSINNRWNLWVLGYGPETQLQFLTKFGLKNPTAYTMTLILTISITILIAIIGLSYLKQKKSGQNDALQQAYLKLCNQLSKSGYTRLPHEGPEDFAARIATQNPPLGTALKPLFGLYAQLRYSRHSVTDPARFFRSRIRYNRHILKNARTSF